MSKRYWVSILILVLIIYFYIPLNAKSSEDGIKTLEKLNEDLYSNVKIKEYGEAKNLIEKIANIVPSIEYNGLTKVEGIDAITSTVIKTKKSLAEFEPKHEEIIYYSTQLYLAIDALTHQEQPLWHRHYTVISQDISRMKQHISSKQNIDVSLNDLKSHYSTIKPAAYVSKEQLVIEKIDSIITAIENKGVKQRDDLTINELEESFNILFNGKDQETWGGIVANSILWKTSFGMGFIIFVTLSYVTWRKFKGGYATAEQNHFSK